MKKPFYQSKSTREMDKVSERVHAAHRDELANARGLVAVTIRQRTMAAGRLLVACSLEYTLAIGR